MGSVNVDHLPFDIFVKQPIQFQKNKPRRQNKEKPIPHKTEMLHWERRSIFNNKNKYVFYSACELIFITL